MKHVISVSLGTSDRDHEASMTILGHEVLVSRFGSDGNLKRAQAMIQEWDGRVDAIGLGGIDRYLVIKDQRFEIQDAVALAASASTTPVVDGSGIKDTLERRTIERLHRDGVIHGGQSVLMVSAMDRFGMAEAFGMLGYRLIAGDLIFASRINYPIRSVEELEELARKLLPELTRLPFEQLYPVGDAQRDGRDPRFTHYFSDADIIAGDFHYIRRYMPDSLPGKIIITNTTTRQDTERLRKAGVSTLVTTTPVLGSRSFGANVMEAALVAVTGVLPNTPDWAKVVEASQLTGTRLEFSSV